MMTGRERLMATLRGEPVDRPAVSFYEIGGFQVDPADPDPYNIYNSPDWQPLLRLAEECTDLIRMMSPVRARSIDPTGSASSAASSSAFFRSAVTAAVNSSAFIRHAVTAAVSSSAPVHRVVARASRRGRGAERAVPQPPRRSSG